MKIAYLVSQYPAIHHTFVLREVRRLREEGLTVGVISVRAPDRPATRLTLEEQQELRHTRQILGAPRWRLLWSLLNGIVSNPLGILRGLWLALRLGDGEPRSTLAHLGYLAEAIIAGRWMMEDGHSHFHVHFASTVGLLVTTMFPLTMSMTVHGPDEFSEPGRFHLASKVNACTAVCVISHFARSQVMRFSAASQWSKIELSRLGVDTTLYTPRPHRSAPEPFELLCVARLAPVKGHHLLLEAVARLRHDRHPVRLRLVGDGPDRARLEARARALDIEQFVVFEGWQTQDAVRDLYERADAFVLASLAEGIPVVLMEAMAMAIPCVATWVAGVPELITDGIEGLLTAPSDADALVRAISVLIQDPELCRRLGSAARKKILADYDLATNVAGLAVILRRQPRPSGRRDGRRDPTRSSPGASAI